MNQSGSNHPLLGYPEEFWPIEKRFFPDRNLLKTHLEKYHRNHSVVTTNGCFDILHRGHVDLLRRAAEQGDILVVAINTDASIRRLKGEDRPVNCVADRAFILAGLRSVGYVTMFDEPTPVETLAILNPDIHVKGGDYRPEDMPETAIVEASGGQVRILPFVDGYSTTSILSKSRKK